MSEKLLVPDIGEFEKVEQTKTQGTKIYWR